MGNTEQSKRNKYKKLGIIAIALLCIFQLLLFANKDDEPTITTEHEEELIVNLKQKVKEKTTASIQGSWQDIHFDLLVTSPRGNPIYWNNINLSDSDFKASGNEHSYEKGTIYYKVKDNNLEYQYKAQPWYISLLKWLSLVTLLLSFLAVILISQITIDGEVKTISLVLASTGITAVYWLLGNILLLPHDLTTTILSVGLLEINSLHYLLSFISVSAIVSPMSKVIARLVTIPLIRGMIGSFIVSCLIYTICTYIKHTLSIDVSAAGLNLPIQYSSFGITLLGISSFLILFTFYISTTIHSASIMDDNLFRFFSFGSIFLSNTNRYK